MSKLAFVFPGQGSQAVGMETDLAESAIGQERFKQAEEILGWSVLDTCRQDEENLSRTLYTQPCLYVVESILTDILIDEGGYLPQYVAGHSLGEYSALYAARVFGFDAGLRLVQQRAKLMDQAGGGKMVALMKFDRAQLEETLAKTSDVVLANDNSSQQVVISGTPEAVDSVLSEVKAKRAVPLKVSGAFHSPLMEEVAQDFQKILDEVPFGEALIPVLSNVDPIPSTDPTELKSRLMQQMTGTVRWQETLIQLAEEGVSELVEVGPGNVLTGLCKRTCPSLELKNIDRAENCQI
ncbi:ACP S-malonyltransferase [Euhalothece natronophila Z-M001]|uniref:Malonyl CoA-acyl carrier protein transacylase n=1 Tax=Euhalothece natronophila Z-M001 TaxID=522448 RepID=A0A5B8NI69_9CHRO|nr:ACP S-malonyltransferase [Euhalothece natronophila]QDZ38893.1 ACP S-malonyltransferase [Euhalothece natronophila Z-M001]